MKYNHRFSSGFESSLNKLKKKDTARFLQVQKKILEIIKHPEHYKPLRHHLKGRRRAHTGPFVIIFRFRNDLIKFLSIEHHDKAY